MVDYKGIFTEFHGFSRMRGAEQLRDAFVLCVVCVCARAIVCVCRHLRVRRFLPGLECAVLLCWGEGPCCIVPRSVSRSLPAALPTLCPNRTAPL